MTAPRVRVQGSAFPRANLALALILLGSAALRLVFLGYSHFQGDEVSALYPLQVPFPRSVLEQLKGPIQLLVTLVVHRITGRYNEWQTRLPFSLASLAGVYVVYLFMRDGFSRRVALWSAALVGSCGLIVAFGRTVQYQAFVMLGVSSAAFFLLRWTQRDRPVHLYLGLAAFVVAVLAHYDAITFLPALLLSLAWGFRTPNLRTRSRFTHLILASLLAALLAGIFYVPFVLRPGFHSVAGYLQSRVTGEVGLRTFAETGRLLGLYLPPFYLTIVAGLAMLGAIEALRREFRPAGIVLAAWFASPFFFYMFLGGQPRSHVYMYLFPALMLAGLGADRVVSLSRSPWVKSAVEASGAAILLLVFGVTALLMVDHSKEHPWESKTILGYELPSLATDVVRGVFGFPYRRGLDQVGEMFRSGKLTGTFDSNERPATMEFYIPAPRSSPQDTYFDDPGSSAPDYYLYVHRPFSLRRELPKTVEESYRLMGTVMQNGRTTIDVYAAPWIDSRADSSP